MSLGLTQIVTITKDLDETAQASVTRYIQNQDIESATAATAAQIAAFPNTVAVISMKYYKGNQQLTGTIYCTQTVAALVTGSGSYLQSVHVVQLSNGQAAPLSTTTGTIYAINNSRIKRLLAATPAQIVTYPNALTQIQNIYWSNAQQLTGTLIVTEAIATVQAAS